MADSLLTKYLDPKVLARLSAHQLMARFPMEGSVSGHHKSPHRGSSVEFAEYRNYVPGDDLRRLDWRVFGRTDRFYLKEFEAETNLRCYFVLDCSGSMQFAGHGPAKIDYARRLIATLAYLVLNQGDAAGLLLVNSKGAFDLPAKRNPAHLHTIVEALDKAEAGGPADLPGALHELSEKVRQRALVLLFSDLFYDSADILNCLQHLRFRKHDLGVFHLLDRMELEFRFDQPVRFVDLESRADLVTEPNLIRDAYLRELNTFLEAIRDGCHEFNADYRQVQTSELVEEALASFLVERARTASASPR